MPHDGRILEGLRAAEPQEADIDFAEVLSRWALGEGKPLPADDGFQARADAAYTDAFLHFAPRAEDESEAYFALLRA